MAAPVRAWFVTGTDTGVGKTLVSAALLRAARARGLRVAGLKPVASGSVATAAGLRNEDALVLQREASIRLPYETINPYAYEPAIAPELAAREAGRPIDLDVIARTFASIAPQFDFVVVEGAGGWRVPLNGPQTIGHLAAHLDLPVLLVIGLRLGCVNHALLSAESILAQGLRLAGWIGSQVDPDYERLEDNLATLAHWLPAPRLGVIPHLRPADVRTASEHLDLAPLLA